MTVRISFTGGEGAYADKRLLPFSFSYADCASDEQAYASARSIAEELKKAYPQMTWLSISIAWREP